MRHHNLQVTGSVSVNGISAATAADLATYTGSTDSKISTLQAFTSSVGTTNTFTASTNSRLDSIETITSSNLSRIGSLETISASNIARISSLETTSASVDTLNALQNTRLTNLEIKTGSLATTGSNTFFGTQTFSGSVYIKENLIVQGSSSLQNITASAVDIGTNKIILNVDNPSVRYAGISVYDSGSTGGTGSLWWDSLENHWLYEHPTDSGAPYNSAILISGPKNEGNLGEELQLVNNYVVKAVGGDHISSSAIYDDGTKVTMYNDTLIISSSGNVGIGIPLPITKLNIAGNNNGLGSNNTLRFTDTDTATELNQQIGKIEFYSSDTSTPGAGVKAYIGSFAADSTPDAYLSFGTQDGSGNPEPIERLRITSEGRVGLGITNPKTKFQLGNNLFLDDEGSTYLGQLSFNRAISDGTISNSNYHAHQIQNYLGRLNIQIYKGSGTSETTHQFSGSAFGINNDSPLYALDVATNTTNTFKAFRIQSVDDALITLGSTVTSSQNWTFGASSNTSGQGANLFFIGTSNNTASSISQKVVIKSDGKVGIGTVPTYNLDVLGELAIYGVGLTAASGGVSISKHSGGVGGQIQSYGGDSYLVFVTNASGTNYERMRITKDGYVGIGTTNPGDILDVRRNQNATTNFYFRNTDTTNASSRAYLNVVAGNSSISLLALHNDNLFIAGTSGKDLYFQQSQGGTVNMVITSTGVVRPGANGTQDFGTASYRWGTIYTSDLDLSNGIGDYTIVEGEDDLFLYNNKRNKVYKFALIEVDPSTATPKKS